MIRSCFLAPFLNLDKSQIKVSFSFWKTLSTFCLCLPRGSEIRYFESKLLTVPSFFLPYALACWFCFLTHFPAVAVFLEVIVVDLGTLMPMKLCHHIMRDSTHAWKLRLTLSIPASHTLSSKHNTLGHGRVPVHQCLFRKQAIHQEVNNVPVGIASSMFTATPYHLHYYLLPD